MRQISGLAVALAHVDFDAYSQAEPVQYGPLVVTRWFPSWWGISPWASPFWQLR